MIKLLRLLLALQIALVGGFGAADARVLFDTNGAGKFRIPSLSNLPPAAATLGTLVPSGLLTNGLPSSGILNGATSGSTITSNLAGLTVNSAARTYAWDGTGPSGTTAAALSEALSGTTASSPATVLPTSTGTLKISGRQFYAGEPAMFMILAGYAATSSLTVTSDDGTTLTVGVNSQGYPLVSGQFASTGVKNLTITETPSSGSPTVSTMAVLVSAAPAAPTIAQAKARAAKLSAAAASRKALQVGSNPPTITLNTGNSLVNGRSLATGGATVNTAVPDGASGGAASNTQSVALGAYIYADTTTPAFTYAMGMTKRWVFTGTTGSRFDMKTSNTGASWGSEYITVLWTDDADSAAPTWFSQNVKTTVFKAQVAYFDVSWPTPPPRAGSRAVEVIFGGGQAANSFNFEAGATIAAYDDARPRASFWNDSYDYGQGTLDQAYGVPSKTTMDAFGTRNAYNFGHRTNAWARLGGSTGIMAMVMDRIGSNPYGYDEATKFGQLDLKFGHMSINDSTLANYSSATASGLKFANQNGNFVQGTVTLQNMLRIAFRRMRQAQQDDAIIIDIGMHGPDAVPPASVLAADRAAFAAVFDSDPLAILADFENGTYRWMGQSFPIPTIPSPPLVPAGAIGSSTLFPPGDCSISATISGAVMTVLSVTNSCRLEPGMGIAVAGSGNPQSQRIGSYGTGTGGTGTYNLEFAPGDVATATTYNYSGDYAHMNQAGHDRWGKERANAALFLASKIGGL